MQTDTRTGIINALAAYTMWGVVPVYLKFLDFMPASEILMHRVIWSLLLLLVCVVALKKWANLVQLLREPAKLKILLLAGLLLGTNWLIFIYAITSEQMLEASLGYFINPLFNVLVGLLFLGERFRLWQKLAIGLAFIGVLNQVVAVGTLPIIALSLAGTFCLYGLLRKRAAVDSFTGLAVETAMMTPLAIIFWLFFAASDYTNMLSNSASLNSLLLALGVITTAPLLCFNAAAKRLNFSTLGLFQYIGPSMMFFFAVFIFKEPLDTARALTFAFIWVALLVFTWDSLRASKTAKTKAA